ncbi:hypothetical protein Btru_030623 [Bulinus truncatus]|nr:hypothetical protein Btru_030623 [Bulinus truncatus]
MEIVITIQCTHKAGYGFRRGGYTCVCGAGLVCPWYVELPFQGEDIERATDYEYENSFSCKKIQLVRHEVNSPLRYGKYETRYEQLTTAVVRHRGKLAYYCGSTTRGEQLTTAVSTPRVQQVLPVVDNLPGSSVEGTESVFGSNCGLGAAAINVAAGEVI